MNNLKNDPLALALNLTLRVLNLTLTLRVLALNLTLTLRVLVLVLNMAQGGQYLSQLLRHLRVVCSHDAFQICNLPIQAVCSG
jgi:hypothetical protein